MVMKKTSLSEAAIDTTWRKGMASLLTIGERAKVWESGYVIDLPRRAELFCENDKADTLYYIRSGKLKIEIGRQDDEGVIVGLRGPGEIAGYRAIIAGEKHSTTATAIEPTELVGISRRLALDIFAQNTKMAGQVTRIMAKQVKDAQHRLWAMTHKQLRGRLADSLLFLCDTFGYAAGTQCIDILLTREELGQLSNMNTANAIRTLATFVTEGIIETKGRSIAILDEEALRRTSEIG